MVAITRPLDGIRVVEFAGLAPGPFCGLVLADLGATVVRVDNPASIEKPSNDFLCRGKQSIAISPKIPAGQAALVRLISESDVLIDPFRPGVMEKLGLGPDVFLGPQGKNQRLIYARLVGFDRHGEFKKMAGHDLNYLAHSGILAMMPPSTPEGRPSFPLNILADMAGGGLICATGVIAALLLLARSPEARGQVVETDMVAGARYISSFNLIQALIPDNRAFGQPPGQSLLDGGAPFYNSYQCADGGWMSVGCIEPQFYQTFCTLLQNNLGSEFLPPSNAIRPDPVKQHDRSQWASVALWIETAFKTRPRQEWEDIFTGTDACVIAVLTPSEAARIHGPEPAAHPNFVDLGDTGLKHLPKPNVASPSSNVTSASPPALLLPGAHTFEILRRIGINGAGIIELQKQGALGGQSEVVSKPKL